MAPPSRKRVCRSTRAAAPNAHWCEIGASVGKYLIFASKDTQAIIAVMIRYEPIGMVKPEPIRNA
jgi:hypothetical protein